MENIVLGKSSLISMISNMKVLTLERKSVGVRNQPVCTDSIHHETSEIILCVTNLTEAIYTGISSLIPIAKKVHVRCHTGVI
jgi:hypothetical protein